MPALKRSPEKKYFHHNPATHLLCYNLLHLSRAPKKDGGGGGEGEREARAKTNARKREGLQESKRFETLRNAATAARINRSRNLGEFIRFGAATLKARGPSLHLDLSSRLFLPGTRRPRRTAPKSLAICTPSVAQ